MKNLVLIDSSVWIEIARKDGDLQTRYEVIELLEQRRAAMSWPIWMELHQGARGRREEENLRGWREVCHWLAFDDECWVQATSSARACQRAGVNVPSADILVYACSMRHKVGLKERDRHFAMIRKAAERGA
jgi:predicted nucleic acid-binding protein